MSEATKLKPGSKRKLSDSARKRNKKAANAKLNKSRIYIGDEYDRWMEIKTALRLETNSAYNCYQDNSPGCVTNLLNSLQWESLQQRRWKQSLVMCYKIHHQLIAIEPANYYTTGDSRTRGNHRFRQIRAKKDTYQHSFFPRSIRKWNQVPSSVVDAGSLEDFKVRLNSIHWLSSQHR